MKKLIPFIVCTFLSLSTAFAQIGIGTNSPQAALDVGGTVRIKNLPVEVIEDISLTGLTSGNTLNRTGTGGNILVQNNEITTAPVTRELGDHNLGLEPIDRYIAGIPQIESWDLQIAAGAVNEKATFINVHSYNSKYLLAGIKNGYEGRRVTLFFSALENIKFKDEDTFALPKNRLTILASTQSISSEGFAEFVYDADAGPDGLGRWLLIKLRS